MSEMRSESQVLNQMIGGYWISQAIYVAAELGIADLLAKGPQSADRLAEQTQTQPEPLYRLLRALAGVGIFAEGAPRQFSLTPMAEPLRGDVPGSQRAFARMLGSEVYRAWGNLLHSVRTGQEAFGHTLGSPLFEYLGEHPERGAIFDAAMTGIHGPETGPMIDAYDFSQFETVVDVGGGNGMTLTEILRRNPQLQGILFDMAPVAERARGLIGVSPVADRCRIEAGDFFSSVPRGDAYVLRHILHDWDDDRSVAILRNCREAMVPGGKVLVIESVIPPGNKPFFGKWLDLMMLVIGGRERTEEQYRRLFDQAGLRLNRIVPTAHEVSVVEGVAA